MFKSVSVFIVIAISTLFLTTSALASSPQGKAANVITEYFSKIVDLCAAASSAGESEDATLLLVDDLANYICRNLKNSDPKTVRAFKDASRNTCAAAFKCGDYNEECKSMLKRGINRIMHNNNI
jgi:hypothetical protein